MAPKQGQRAAIRHALFRTIETAPLPGAELLTRAWTRTLKLLPARPRRLARALSARLQQAMHGLPTRRGRLLRRGALRQRVVEVMEQRTAAAFRPVASRLGVVSGADVEALRRRIRRLERLLAKAAPPATPTTEVPSSRSASRRRSLATRESSAEHS